MRIVHIADAHLGFRQYGMAERQQDYLTATQYVFQQAKELKADCITLGGDQFQATRPDSDSVVGLHDTVVNAGRPVFGIDGNHDYTDSGWLHVCGITALDRWDQDKPVVTVLKGQQVDDKINIFGLNSSPPSIFRKRLSTMVEKFKADGTRLDILVIHMPLADLWGMGIVDVTAMEISKAVREIGTRLVLMGDIHDYKETVIGGVRFIYPGSVEMTASDEQQDKSFSVIDITSDELKTSIYPIPVRPVLDVTIDSQAALDNLVKDVSNAGSSTCKPLVVVSYDPALKGFASRAQSLLEGKALYRLIPYSDTQSSDLFQQVKDSTFERKGALHNLRDVLLSSFKDSSDEYALILRMLDSPDNVEDIVVQYAKSKGLDSIK